MAISLPVEPGTRALLRVLGTSDLHMHLMGYDYCADRPDDTAGLTYTASLIRKARAEVEASGGLILLFDNGDAMQGTPMGDLVAESPEKPHPLMRAFDHLGYDAIGLGNHDFNFGLASLDRVLAQATCPVVCSNLRRIDPDVVPQIAPYALLERSIRVGHHPVPIRIGVLSFLPPQTVRWDAHLLQGRIAVDDIVGAAQHWVPQLQREGCDVIVALAHSGLGNGPAHMGMENAVLPLAGLDGIDAIIAGHTHLHLPSPTHTGLDPASAEIGAVHGTPVVMPGSAGSHLGLIDLDLQITPQGRWTVRGFDCALRAVSGQATTGSPVGAPAPATAPEDPSLRALLAPYHAVTRQRMGQPVGRSAQALHSYFSFIAPDRSLAVVAAAQAAALRPALIGTEAADLPLLSATAPDKYGGRSGPLSYTDVPAGLVARRHVADLYIFPNQLCAVVVNGQQVLDWLEMSASLFHRIIPGNLGQALLNGDFPGHNFDVLHGLTWQIDVSVPARFHPDGTLRPGDNRRIRNLCHGGSSVSAGQRFVVALNNYRASGGGGFAALTKAHHLPVGPMDVRNILQNYLAGLLPPDPLAAAPPPWGFVSMPGTTVTALTGPGAIAHLPELAGRDVQLGGFDADGFLCLDLPL